MNKFIKSLTGLLIFAAIGSDSSFTYAQNDPNIQLTSNPVKVGELIADNIIGRRVSWRYQNACTYYGSLVFADVTGNKDITNQLKALYTPFYTGKRKPWKGHVDYNVFGIWPFELYRQTGDEKYLQVAQMLAEDEYKNPREDGLCEYTRFWVDDMYMVGSLQVQAFKSTGDKKYIDRAALQLKTYCEELQRPNGMFHHREDAPFFWGRGNGWAAAAFTELLMVLPEDHEYYPVLLGDFQKMMRTIASFQGEDGMWHQLIDDPESFPESSCTGMFLFALASAIDNGWLPYDEYLENVEKAWNALAGYVNGKGEVENVCIGTNAKDDKKHYLTRPVSTGNFHGQAAVIWAATAMVRLSK